MDAFDKADWKATLNQNNSGMKKYYLDKINFLLVKLQESERATEKMYDEEKDKVTDEYAFKYGAMIGRVNVLVEELKYNVTCLEKHM